MELFSKHHVGGRNGRGGFPAVPKLHSSIASTMYEADESCISEIESEQLSHGYGKVNVLSACLAGSVGTRNFNLNYDGYTSSLLPLNEKYANFYQQLEQSDYNYDYVMSTLKQLSIQTVTLDSLSEKLPVDFLSLDTQGSELEILKGAVATLKSCVGIETEVSFRQVYKDSDLFGDISLFLSEQGFEFIGFTSLTFDAPRSMSQKGRCRKLLSFADALFFRIPDPNMTDDQKIKLVFTALVYGQLEYAMFCVNKLNLFDFQNTCSRQTLDPTYVDFVSEFIRISRTNKTSTRSRPTIGYEAMKRRLVVHLSSTPHTQVMKGMLLILKKIERLCLLLIRALTRPVNTIYNSELEMLFSSVGLMEIAKALKATRLNIASSRNYLRL